MSKSDWLQHVHKAFEVSRDVHPKLFMQIIVCWIYDAYDNDIEAWIEDAKPVLPTQEWHRLGNTITSICYWAYTNNTTDYMENICRHIKAMPY